MITLAFDRRRTVGLASGSVWLIAVGVFFAAWSLVEIATPGASALLVLTLIGGAALLTFGVTRIRQALRRPRDVPSRTPADRAIGRRFGLIVGAELVAIAIANPVAAAFHRFEVIPSLDLFIVGVHFLPLASLFRVPRYYVTGLLFCAIPAFTLLLVPATARVGHAAAWFVAPSLGCGLVAAATGLAGLLEVRRELDASVA